MSEPTLEQTTDTLPVGWFGKLPRAADFLSRDLPASFTRPVAEWLNASVGAAQDSLGEDFERIYLTAPIWRFAFAPGVVDGRPWSGVLMASCDSAGRSSPFTIAAEASPGNWLKNAEKAAVAFLDDQVPLEIAPIKAPPQQDGENGCVFWREPAGCMASSSGLPPAKASVALFTQDWVGAGWTETRTGKWRWD